jgi:hypothetical protein
MKLLLIRKKGGEVVGEAMVDDEFYMYSTSNNLRWGLSGKRYVIGKLGRRVVYMHREVLMHAGYKIPPKAHVDHLDRNPYNNQLSNLELKTCSDNVRNSKLHKDSTHGIKGVAFSRTSKKYYGQVSAEGRWKYLGLFNTKEEAGYAYDDEVARLTGSYLGTNQDLGLLPWRNNVTNQTTDPKLDKVAATYIKIRDKRSELKKQYETEDQALKAQLETLESFFFEKLKSLGAESIRTKHGTVYQSLAIKPSCEDWTSFYTWITENEAFDALEKRVKRSFVVDYMNNNSGGLPPGITVLKEYTVTIRRS